MKLHYWNAKPNFGDELNPWIWPQLFPKPLENYLENETLFLGIGSILGQEVPQEPKKLVFSSGFAPGYGTLPMIDDRWQFSCVRGPLTAKALELSESTAVCDGALLLRKFFAPATLPTHDAIFVPHHSTAELEPLWKQVCEAVGVLYLDPRVSVETAVETIRTSQLVITESLHGAIIADAFRVPWIPVQTRSYINEFKWQDWSQSLQLEHQFEWLPPVQFVKGPFQEAQRKYLAPLRSSLSASRLLWLKRFGKRRLSQDKVCEEVYQRLVERFEELVEAVCHQPVSERLA